VIFPILVIFWLSCIARLLLSWRHASIERRQQLKWLLTGCAITLASGVLSIAAVPAAFQSTVDFISDLGFVALPVCVGIAVLRYRLYDIDRLSPAPWPTPWSPARSSGCMQAWYC
jgi:hypothetical protein